MLRRLIVMRHAKSSWNTTASSDHERPLNDRGRRDAPRIGAKLVELGWTPDFILSSDAQRTQETTAGLNESFPEPVPATFLRSLYLAGPKSVREETAHVDDSVECLLVLGHNPGWEQLVYDLSGEQVVMKTATAALLTREIDSWSDAFNTPSWNLDHVLYPRELS